MEKDKEYPFIYSDIVFHVVSFLRNSDSFLTLRLVSRTWNQVVTHRQFWQRNFLEEMKIPPKPTPLNYSSKDIKYHEDEFSGMKFFFQIPPKHKEFCRWYNFEFEESPKIIYVKLNIPKQKEKEGKETEEIAGKEQKEEAEKDMDIMKQKFEDENNSKAEKNQKEEENQIVQGKERIKIEASTEFNLLIELKKQKKKYFDSFYRSRKLLFYVHDFYKKSKVCLISIVPSLMTLLTLSYFIPLALSFDLSFYFYFIALFSFIIFYALILINYFFKWKTNFLMLKIKARTLESFHAHYFDAIYNNILIGFVGLFPSLVSGLSFYLKYTFSLSGIIVYLPLIFAEGIYFVGIILHTIFYLWLHFYWDVLENNKHDRTKAIGQKPYPILFFKEDHWIVVIFFAIESFLGLMCSIIFNIFVSIQIPIFIEFESVIPSYIYSGLLIFGVLIFFVGFALYTEFGDITSDHFHGWTFIRKKYLSKHFLILYFYVVAGFCFILIIIAENILISFRNIALGFKLIPIFCFIPLYSLFTFFYLFMDKFQKNNWYSEDDNLFEDPKDVLSNKPFKKPVPEEEEIILFLNNLDTF